MRWGHTNLSATPCQTCQLLLQAGHDAEADAALDARARDGVACTLWRCGLGLQYLGLLLSCRQQPGNIAAEADLLLIATFNKPAASMAAAGAAPDGGCGGLVEVLKSPQDKKLYRYLRLDSGMSVLLISDPDINSSGADQDQQVCALRMDTNMGCRHA